MAVLTDFEIKSLGNQGMIVPFNPNQIKTVKDINGQDIEQEILLQPASLDIRIGNNLKRLVNIDLIPSEPKFEDVDLTKYSKEKPYIFMPEERILVESLETFNMPSKVSGHVCMRSTPARNFIQHINAGYIDPMFSNSKLTMELINWSYCPFNLYPGLSITQVVFFWLNGTPTTNYLEIGSYNNDLKVQEAKK